MGDNHSRTRAEPGGGGTSRLEWIAGAASGLLVLGLVGFLLYQGAAATSEVPDVEIVAGSQSRVAAGYLVEFTALNHSRSTAASLIVTGELLRDTTVVESSSVTLDYVPGGGQRTGGLFFADDPTRFVLKVRPEGYADP